MRNATLQCIILGHKNFGESDKIIFLYNENLGKIRAVAKGARKLTSKFTGHLETLNVCTVCLYFAPKNTIITEINSDQTYRFRGDLEQLSSALQVAEITNQMLYENQSLENLDKLIIKTLSHLAQAKTPTLISTGYIIKLLDKIGLLPDFAGIDREKSSRINVKYLKFFQFLKDKSFSEITKITLTQKEKENIKKILKNIIESQTYKTASFLNI